MKSKYLLLILTSLCLIFTSCSKDELNDIIVEEANPEITLRGNENGNENGKDELALIGEGAVLVGTLTVKKTGNHLTVKYNAEGDWTLVQTRLFTGDRDQFPLDQNGNPNISQFPHGNNNHAAGTRTVSYKSPYNGEDLTMLVAQAIAENSNGDRIVVFSNSHESVAFEDGNEATCWSDGKTFTNEFGCTAWGGFTEKAF